MHKFPELDDTVETDSGVRGVLVGRDFDCLTRLHYYLIAVADGTLHREQMLNVRKAASHVPAVTAA